MDQDGLRETFEEPENASELAFGQGRLAVVPDGDVTDLQARLSVGPQQSFGDGVVVEPEVLGREQAED